MQARLIGHPEQNLHYLILCSHPPVITYSKDSSLQNLRVPSDGETELVKISRGGDITFHDPGQAILYPVLNLKSFRPDVGWYLRQLEAVVLETLRGFGILGLQIEKQTGVWISERKKICSIGVKLSRWCSIHGLALNVLASTGFDQIYPCGFRDILMTSVSEERKIVSSKKLTVELALERLSADFCAVFNCRGEPFEGQLLGKDCITDLLKNNSDEN